MTPEFPSRQPAATGERAPQQIDDTGRVQPLAALRALKRLVADPEQTEQVFVIIRALSGNALRNAFDRFRTTPVGRRVLAEELDLMAVLTDREALRQLPSGSLGRAYLAFVEREQITAEGLAEASAHEAAITDPELLRFATRQRDMHDLWHVITGYGRDSFGEVCLLGFTYAQTRNRGLGVICLVGSVKTRRALGKGVYRAVWKAWRAGRRAAWLPEQDWEHLLAQPLAQVRAQLRIDPPQEYEAVLAGVAATA
ncbi:MAG: Coq4 family protein [Pseudomonadota bacterium]